HADDGDHYQHFDQGETAPLELRRTGVQCVRTLDGLQLRPTQECDVVPEHRLAPPARTTVSCHFADFGGAATTGGTSQIFTVPSRLAEARWRPSGLNATP